MTLFKGTWRGIPKALLAVLIVALAGACSLITSVDRDEIKGDGGSAPIGGSGGGGGATGGTAGTGGTGGGPYGAGGTAAAAYHYDDVLLPEANAEPVTLGIDFAWERVPARPAPVDLSVELGSLNSPIVQVFSVDDAPFVRVGTNVEKIEVGTAYRLEVSREGAAVWTQVVRASDGHVLVEGPIVQVDSQASVVVTLVRPQHRAHVQLLDLMTWRGLGT